MPTSTPAMSPTTTPVTTDDPVGPTWSARTAAVLAGGGILVLAVLAALAHFGVVEALVTPGDAERTARDIAGAEPLFRVGVAGLLLAAVLDVVVSVALLALLAPVHRGLAALATAFRLAYTAVFVVAIHHLVTALAHLDDADRTLAATEDFAALFDTALVLFAVHLAVLGMLTLRTLAVPRVIGVLLVVAGAGYLVDGFGTILLADYTLNAGLVTFAGEALLAGWLLVRGGRRPLVADRRPAADRRQPGRRPTAQRSALVSR